MIAGVSRLLIKKVNLVLGLVAVFGKLCVSKETKPTEDRMKGTEKQVKWATEIKADMLKGLESACRPEMIDLFNAEVERRDSAKWWIDAHRVHGVRSVRELMGLIAKEMK